MKTDLSALPAGKQRELRHLVDVLLEEFGKLTATRQAPRLRDGQVLKIILFGSYARGDWVEDPIGRYFSDYDLLIVVDHDDLADTVEFWDTAEARILKELSDGEHLRTPVNFIVHSLQDVNHQLSRGRYFFTDILRDGIVLHDVAAHQLAAPAQLPAKTVLEEATGFLEDGLVSASRRLELATFSIGKGYSKEAAFELHQSTEWLYNTVLLTLTLYTPKSHNLVRLRSLAEPLDRRLQTVWPRETKSEKRSFELLREAYIKARYSKHYRITDDELDWLSGRVHVMQELVRTICEDYLADLARRAAAE